MATLAEKLSTAITAHKNCEKFCNKEWQGRWAEKISYIVQNLLPSGGGFDSGTTVLQDECSDVKLVFTTAFHHMDEYGGYCGWTYYKVIATPTFNGLNVKVSVVEGQDLNETSGYVADTFYTILSDTTRRCE